MSTIILIVPILVVWIPATPMILMYWAFGLSGMQNSKNFRECWQVPAVGVILTLVTYINPDKDKKI